MTFEHKKQSKLSQGESASIRKKNIERLNKHTKLFYYMNAHRSTFSLLLFIHPFIHVCRLNCIQWNHKKCHSYIRDRKRVELNEKFWDMCPVESSRIESGQTFCRVEPSRVWLEKLDFFEISPWFFHSRH